MASSEAAIIAVDLDLIERLRAAVALIGDELDALAGPGVRMARARADGERAGLEFALDRLREVLAPLADEPAPAPPPWRSVRGSLPNRTIYRDRSEPDVRTTEPCLRAVMRRAEQ